MTKEETFAAKHGYTMAQIEEQVYKTLNRSKHPVWSPSQLAGRILKAGTNDIGYRHVLRACHNLHKKQMICMENWWGVNNVTVVWSNARFIEKIEEELPY